MQSYDEEYKKTEFYWGTEPNGLCQQVVNLLAAEFSHSKRVLDLGCGEGKDVLHFARHGHHAVGIDLSMPGIEKARRWAEREGIRAEFQQADMNEFRIRDRFDVIYSSGTLTYLSPDVRGDAFENYKQHTDVGGIHAFNVFVEKPYIATPPDWGTDEYFYRSGELLQYYWDWEVIEFKEVIFDCNSSGIRHRHAMDVMIVRKVM